MQENKEMQTPVLELKGIYKSFTGHRVLNNIDLTIYPGEVVCLAGENGCGKSTLIKIISGVYDADSGSVSLGGIYFPRLDPVVSIKQGVQVIYQDFSVFPNLTVAENISLGMQLVEGNRIMHWKQAHEQAKRALETIGISMDLDEEVSRLSVAQKQVVAISRAILQDARLIIMDEPTTALTNREIERLYEIIRGLAAKGIAVMFVSHKLEEIFAVCDRIVVIRNGIKVADEVVENFNREDLPFYMTGERIAEEPFEYHPQAEIPTLEVRGLCQEGAFRDISFNLFPGEILGITGQLGSGRTELAKALFGIGKITNGQIIVHGEEQHFRDIQDAKKARIGYVPEDRLSEGLFMQRSLKDNFSAATIDRKRKWGFLVDAKKVAEEALRRISELHINADDTDVLANTFSGGNQQRIVIGKWLATEPEILILNGPTVGVDIKSKSEIHRILRELASQGMCIIMISDDVGELMTTTNRIMVMNRGRIIYESSTCDTSADILNQKILQDEGMEEAAG